MTTFFGQRFDSERCHEPAKTDSKNSFKNVLSASGLITKLKNVFAEELLPHIFFITVTVSDGFRCCFRSCFHHHYHYHCYIYIGIAIANGISTDFPCTTSPPLVLALPLIVQWPLPLPMLYLYWHRLSPWNFPWFFHVLHHLHWCWHCQW